MCAQHYYSLRHTHLANQLQTTESHRDTVGERVWKQAGTHQVLGLDPVCPPQTVGRPRIPAPFVLLLFYTLFCVLLWREKAEEARTQLVAFFLASCWLLSAALLHTSLYYFRLCHLGSLHTHIHTHTEKHTHPLSLLTHSTAHLQPLNSHVLRVSVCTLSTSTDTEVKTHSTSTS